MHEARISFLKELQRTFTCSEPQCTPVLKESTCSIPSGAVISIHVFICRGCRCSVFQLLDGVVVHDVSSKSPLENGVRMRRSVIHAALGDTPHQDFHAASTD